MTKKFTNVIDSFHAKLCYQLFVTPIYLPLPKPYRNFARRACEYLELSRNQLLYFDTPMPHVIHHFAPSKANKQKKILITHGWGSRSAYMIRLIRSLHKEGYEVYALDFPAHGEAKGMQCTWLDAVTILNHVVNKFGPFYAVLGHSFGGSMLLNMMILSNQYENWHLPIEPSHVILLASPTRMRTPVGQMARQLKLNKNAYQCLRKIFRQQTDIDLKRLNFKHFYSNSKVNFLCIHGLNDTIIPPIESILFCNYYPHATLSLLPDVDHVNILIDERVDQQICKFLNKLA